VSEAAGLGAGGFRVSGPALLPKEETMNDSRTTLQELKERMAEFVREREWEQLCKRRKGQSVGKPHKQP